MYSLRRFSGLLALILLLPACSVAARAQDQLSYLASYIGNWRGAGVLVGGEQPETFSCRMTVSKGNQGKINYAGRCAVAGLNLAVQGTIAYNNAAGRYEAVMTSNTRFSGLAIGQRQNETIVFDLKERQATEGDDISIGAQIRLREGTMIVDFDIEFNNSGQTMHTSVPFARS